MSKDKCSVAGCKSLKGNGHPHCSFHTYKIDPKKFLQKLYQNMLYRTKGKSTRTPYLYKGLSICSKDEFLIWASNSHRFKSLYNEWTDSGFDCKLTPSVNRIDSSEGYIINNVEWVTASQNYSMANSAKYKKSQSNLGTQ